MNYFSFLNFLWIWYEIVSYTSLCVYPCADCYATFYYIKYICSQGVFPFETRCLQRSCDWSMCCCRWRLFDLVERERQGLCAWLFVSFRRFDSFFSACVWRIFLRFILWYQQFQPKGFLTHRLFLYKFFR